MLEGKSFPVSDKQKTQTIFIAQKGKSMVSAKSFDSTTNNQEYVAVISLKDPIYKYNQECGPRGTKFKQQVMSNYEQDPNCLGVVLDIDSGGGQVSGTPEFHDYILNYSKPVVSYTDGMMCSAAYYIGSAADHIVANKRADAIGSIGVMVHFIDFSGFYEKKGANVITEYATQSTEKNRAFEELLQGKPENYIKTELDPIAEQFINDIKSVRPGVDASVYAGGTWDANGSLTNKLVDEIGSLQNAIDKVYDLAKSGSNSNNNNSNHETMSKKTKSFPTIQKLISVEGEGLTIVTSLIPSQTGVEMSEAQLETIETELAGKETAVNTANGKVTTAEGKVTALETAVNTAIETAGLTAAVGAEATTEEKIALLSTKVVEYGKNPGARGTKPGASGDVVEDENAIVDAKDDHNAAYNKA